MNYGKKLEQILKNQRITQTELAKKSGVSQGVISAYIKKGSIPSEDYFEKINNALQTLTNSDIGITYADITNEYTFTHPDDKDAREPENNYYSNRKYIDHIIEMNTKLVDANRELINAIINLKQ